MSVQTRTLRNCAALLVSLPAAAAARVEISRTEIRS